MLHAYVQRFDVKGTMQKILETKQGPTDRSGHRGRWAPPKFSGRTGDKTRGGQMTYMVREFNNLS